MLGSALNATVSGLRAQSAAVAVASENIVNNATPDYKRKGLDVQSIAAGSTALSSLNSIGGGVTFSIVESMSDQGIGSNTDDLTNMVRAQQAYTSSALVLNKVDKMYEALLDAIG